jgi:hypothetical protein
LGIVCYKIMKEKKDFDINNLGIIAKIIWGNINMNGNDNLTHI